MNTIVREWTMSDPNPGRFERELAQICREIAWYEEETRKTVGLALQYKLEIGKRLARAKGLMPHGTFLAWARAEFGWTPRHVQNHLILAANAKRVSHLGPEASLRMALAAIKEAEADPEVRKGVESTKTVPNRKIHVVGEIEEGTIDCKQLVDELVRIAAVLGAPRTKWKAH
jgi:Protein of unknown function (DUF3102)